MAFESKWSDDKGPQHVIVFAHPPAIKAMGSSRLNLHFDGTIKMTPARFEQVCILGMRDDTSEKHSETVFEQIKHCCIGKFLFG